MITMTLISSCYLKTLKPFFLQKKILEKAFLTLRVNYRKIEKHIMPFKTIVNWIFDDIGCYLVTGCFD